MALLALFGVASTWRSKPRSPRNERLSPTTRSSTRRSRRFSVGGQLSSVLQGELRGAGYIIEVPPNWNGELVM